MTNYREILRLNSLGINNTQIAESCGYSRPTVINTLRKAKEIGLHYNQVSTMSDRELSELLSSSEKPKKAYKMPDYDYVHQEMQKSGVTLNLLWVEYCEACRAANEMPYQSTQFNKYYADYLLKTGATMHINHKPGEIMEVDWSGQPAAIVNSVTGEIIPAPVFVAVLPYSGYAYVEAFLTQKQEDWTAAHVNAYRFFGGSTRILRPDNTKTAIIKNVRQETVVNKSYQDMAEHYGTAVIPARVKKPRDKASVESGVGVVATWILAALRNDHFFSLSELNMAIREKLEILNHKPFQKKEGSRYSLYQDEKQFMQTLPRHPFELSEWKRLTVQPNYHISCDQQNYSVPYEYIGRLVDVRLTRSTIEMFFDNKRICSHSRLAGRANQYSTKEDHMPPNHKHAVWTGDRFRNWAAKIGVNTSTVIERFLGYYKIEQQSYKACNALLHLADKYSKDRLETACWKALSFTSRPSLKGIQTILKTGSDQILASEEKDQTDVLQYSFTRGANYYGGDDDAE